MDKWKKKPVVASKTPPYLEIDGEIYFAVTITCGGIKKEAECRKLFYSTETDSKDAFEKMWGALLFPCWRRRPETTKIPVKFGYEYWPKEEGDPKYKFGDIQIFDDVQNPEKDYEYIYSTIARVWLPENCEAVRQARN